MINKRKIVKIHKKELTYFSYGGETVHDGLNLPFAFGKRSLNRLKKQLRSRIVGPKETVPFWEMFEGLREEPDEEVHSFEIPWCYDISTWRNYVRFLSSDESKEIERPWRLINPIKKKKSKLLKKYIDENEKMKYNTDEMDEPEIIQQGTKEEKIIADLMEPIDDLEEAKNEFNAAIEEDDDREFFEMVASKL